MSNIAVINDNNNFAPSIFRSLCEFVGDCFGPLIAHKLMTFKKMVRRYYCLGLIQTSLS